MAARTDVCTAPATRACARIVGSEPGEVEVALVETGALDPRDDLAHGRPHGLRVLPVERVARPDEDRSRAASERLRAAHRGVDAEAARDVVRGRDDAPAVRVAADDERLSPQLGLLQLLHGGEERVQVEVGENRHDSNHAGRPGPSPSGDRRARAARGLLRPRLRPGAARDEEDHRPRRPVRRRRGAASRPLVLAARAADGRPDHDQGHGRRRPQPPLRPRYRAGLRPAEGLRSARAGAAARPDPLAHDPHARGATRRHERHLRPGSPHGARCRLERRRALPRRLDAEAGDRGHRPPDARAQARVVHAGLAAARQDARQLRQRRRQCARGVARGVDVCGLGPCQRDDAGARAERLADVRRLRDVSPPRRRDGDDPDPGREPARVRRRQVHDRRRSRAACPCGVSRSLREGAAAAAGGHGLRGQISALAARAGDRPRQARPLPPRPGGDAQGGLADRRPARQRHRRLSRAASSSPP